MDEKKILLFLGTIMLFIYCLSIIPVSSFPQNNLSLIGNWPLNNNANDYSGNSLNGVTVGVTFTTNSSGQIAGNAVFSTNTLGGNQGINLPLSPLLTFSKSTSFEIQAWIKMTGT